MESKLMVKGRNKKKIIAFILIIAMCLALIPITSLGEGAATTPKDVTELITFESVKIYHKGSTTPFIENNQKLTDPAIKVGDKIEVKIAFNITASNCALIYKNDYMEIEVPKFYGLGARPRGKVATTSGGNVFGKFYVIEEENIFKLKVVFDQEGGPENKGGLTEFRAGLGNGLMTASGSLRSATTDGNEIEVGSIIVPKFPVLPGEAKDPDNPYGNFWMGKIHKSGWINYNDNDLVEWQVLFNYEEYGKALRGNNIETRNNVIIEDKLAKELSFEKDSIGMGYQIMMFSHENELTGNTMYQWPFGYSIKDQFNGPIQQTSAHTDYDSFKSAVSSATAPCYGIYKSNTGQETLVMNLGTLPGSLKTPTWGALEARIEGYKFEDSKFDALSEGAIEAIITNTKNAYKEHIYKNTSPSQIDIGLLPGFTISYLTSVDSSEKSLYVSNVAIMNYGNESASSGAIKVLYENSSITADELEQGAIRITKVDADSPTTTLTGASFKITGEKHGDIGPKYVNEQGFVEFENLNDDIYTITEVDSPVGYSKSTEIYGEDGKKLDDNKFTISSSQKKGFKFKAHNHKIVTGSIKLTKYDSVTTDMKLSGASFALDKKNASGGWDRYTEAGTQTTTKSGIVFFDNLPMGEYKVVETSAQLGYDINSFQIKDGNKLVPAKDFTVIISEDKNSRDFTLSGYNKANTGSITLMKYDKDTNPLVPIDGGVFGLYKADDPNETIITTRPSINGKVTFGGLDWDSYKIKEIEAPAGYVGPLKYGEGFNGTFVINGDNGDKSLYQTKYGYNKRDKGTLVLTKKDKENPATLLSGGLFGLLKDGATDSDYYATAPAIDGTVSFAGLEWGDYKLVEIKAPDNYDKDELEFSGDISSTGAFKVTRGALELSASATNGRLPGSFTLEKNDAANANTEINGGLFGLLKDGAEAPNYAATAPAVNNKVKFTGLKWGNYEVVEIDAPEGYDSTLNITNGSKNFTITAGALSKSAKATNEKAIGSIIIKKYDDKVTSQALEGAGFRLLDKDKNPTGLTGTTNGSGVVEFKDIPWGTYYVQETTPPAGYLPGTLSFKDLTHANGVTIKKDQKTVEVIAYNSKSNGSITLTKESDDGDKLSGAAFKLLVWNGAEFVDSGRAEAISGSNGVVTFAGLEFGRYRIEETSASEGYDKESFTIKDEKGQAYSAWDDFEVTVSDTVQKIRLIGQNTMLPGSFVLEKIDGTDDSVKINGGLFKLTKKGDASFNATAPAIDGKVTFTGLEKGEYTIEEVTPPTGYDGKLKFTTTDFDGTFEIKASNRDVKAEAVNERELGDFTLTKKDVESGELLSGGVFKLTSEDGKYEKTTSAKDGAVVFDNLNWGTYTISEEEAPVGYEDGSLTFDEGKTATVIVTKGAIHPTLNGYNKRDVGQITMMKLDGSEQGTLLSGGEFKLSKVGGGYEATTSAINGIVSFSGLEWGDYEITEVTAPTGYDGTLSWSGEFDGVFHVTNSALGVQPIVKTAFNEKVPGVTIIDEDNPTVLGAESGPDSDGDTQKVLGEEAKTADAANIMPLLIAMLMICLILLLVLVLDTRRE